MRQAEEKAFQRLRPNKELYKARTITTRYPFFCDWEFAFLPRHRVEANSKVRLLSFRDRYTDWTGKETLLICTQHYKEAMGVEL